LGVKKSPGPILGKRRQEHCQGKIACLPEMKFLKKAFVLDCCCNMQAGRAMTEIFSGKGGNFSGKGREFLREGVFN
jgi:hypothetical protein